MKTAFSSRPTWATKNENLSREKFAICVVEDLWASVCMGSLVGCRGLAGSQQGNMDDL